MSKGPIGESSFSKAIKTLIHRIHDNSRLADSVYEKATGYFELIEVQEEKLKNTKDAYQRKKLLSEYDELRWERREPLIKLCRDILSLSEANNNGSTHSNSAKMLGTILLLSPTEGKQVAKANQKSKHLYKAILSLRLLDQLLIDSVIKNEYVLGKYQDRKIFDPEDKNQTFEGCPFREDIQIPLLLAVLLQDIGQCHVKSIEILKGKEGNKNEFRVLERDERKAFLTNSFEQTLRFVQKVVGPARYIGNSKDERKVFNQNEKTKLTFILTLLKSALDPKEGVGNLLKVPQVYTSVVLSTKSNFAYHTLPRVSLVIDKGAEQGAFSEAAAKSMMKILGVFPQGFGITYIPKGSDNNDLERYEYAIVVGLYPSQSNVPICRAATRNLEFFSAGTNYRIKPDNNLYYAKARKKLEIVSEKRLREILQMLWSNYNEEKDLELIPKCWSPYDFFAYKKHQNLWNRTTMVTV